MVIPRMLDPYLREVALIRKTMTNEVQRKEFELAYNVRSDICAKRDTLDIMLVDECRGSSAFDSFTVSTTAGCESHGAADLAGARSRSASSRSHRARAAGWAGSC